MTKMATKIEQQRRVTLEELMERVMSLGVMKRFGSSVWGGCNWNCSGSGSGLGSGTVEISFSPSCLGGVWITVLSGSGFCEMESESSTARKQTEIRIRDWDYR